MPNLATGVAQSIAIAMFALLVIVVGTVITYVIIVVANRADPDPTGKRPMAVFLFGGAFLTLWIAYVGAIAVVTNLVGLIGTRQSTNSFTSELHPIGDAAVRGVSMGLLLLLIGGTVHVLHRSRGLELAESETNPASPTKRVARSYVAVVSFVTVLILVVTTLGFLYGILSLIAPGVYGASARVDTLRQLLDTGFV